MPTFFLGLPLHVLVVHAVVVLVPIAVVGAILVAILPRLRPRWGWPVVVLAAVAVAAIPVATSSGEGLEHQLPREAAISTHTGLGDQLLPFAAVMLLALLALMMLERARRRSTAVARHAGPGTMAASRLSPTAARAAAVALAGLVVVLGVISAVQVVRIGDSGARAAWADTQYVQQAPGAPDGD